MAVYGLLGRKLGHSLSPQLHSFLYRELSYDATYNLFEVEPQAVGQVVGAMRTLGIGGMNVTIPYKQDILPFLDHLSPEARTIGAVNTVAIRPDGSSWGYNTDYFGFSQSLQQSGITVDGKKVLLCGMSGAGRAVYQAVVDAGAQQVLVASTSPDKGIPYDSLSQLPPMDIIVNCTPVGMYPNGGVSVVDQQVLAKFKVAVDIVYNPLETRFLQLAKEAGLETVGGLDMLIYQAFKSFEIWTGISPQPTLAPKLHQQLANYFSKNY